MSLAKYEKTIEALLFASGDPVPLRALARILDLDMRTTEDILMHMMDQYTAEEKGFLIRKLDDSYQLCSNPIYYDEIRSLIEMPQKKTLTQPLLETLAIIAYRQPVTKTQIEEIRGVTADHAVNRLLEYSLICEAGRQETPGRPILFGTSDEFLRHFGLSTLDDLPPLPANLAQLKKEAEEELHF